MAHITAAKQKLHNNSLIVHCRHAKRLLPDRLGLNMFWSLFSTYKTEKVYFSFLFYNRLIGGMENRLCATHSLEIYFWAGVIKLRSWDMNNDWVTSEPISEVRKIHYLSEKIGADGNGSLWDSIEQRSPWAVLLGLCESFFKPTKTKKMRVSE